jgi:hypothetical protein
MPVEPELPPVIDAPVRPPAAIRVAVVLFLFGFLQLAEGIFSFALSFKTGGTINLLAPFGFLWFWAAGVMVWMDKRIIWPLLTYFSALSIGCLAGVSLGFWLGVPGKLLTALRAAEPFWFWFYSGYGLVTVVFLLWLMFEGEALHARWPVSFRRPQIKWLQPRAFLAYLIPPGLLFVWGILALLQGGWTREAVARAREECGGAYDYITINYQVQTTNGRTAHQAVVLAYSESEIRKIPLDWED